MAHYWIPRPAVTIQTAEVIGLFPDMAHYFEKWGDYVNGKEGAEVTAADFERSFSEFEENYFRALPPVLEAHTTMIMNAEERAWQCVLYTK